jgi:uncharacterized protein
MSAVRIDYKELSDDALNGVIEDFVSRDGTDYGEKEVTLESKINQVMNQLKQKKAIIVFDHVTESCTILHKNNPLLKEL